MTVTAGTLETFRQRLHAAPELSGAEHETAAAIAAELARHRPAELHTGVGGQGVLAVWRGDDEGPVVALRAELDGLPIAERGDRPYRSRHAGRQHACGHDGHMTALVGVAAALGRRPPGSGRVALLFQPAEETGAGATRVAADPRWRALAAEWLFAVHNLPGLPLGAMRLAPDTVASASVGLEARLHGSSSHAAYPELGRSPALAVAELITALDGLAGEVLGAAAADRVAVSTVIHARLGEVAFGTAPGEAVVMATLRADDEAVFEQLRQRARSHTETAARRHDLELELAWREPFPVTRNHPDAVAVAARAATAAEMPCEPLAVPMRWSEDVGHLVNPLRGTLAIVGAGVDAPPLHSPDYDFPDALLTPLVRWYLALLAELGLRPAIGDGA